MKPPRGHHRGPLQRRRWRVIIGPAPSRYCPISASSALGSGVLRNGMTGIATRSPSRERAPTSGPSVSARVSAAGVSSRAMGRSGMHLRVATADGSTLHAELFLPVGEGPHPGVVVLHESFGLNNDIRRIASRFAGAGYAALAPNLYSHGRRLICLTRVLVDMTSGRIEREVADIVATREALAERQAAD